MSLTIRDLGSRNGTIVNGEPSVPRIRIPIKESDVIKVGKYLLRIDRLVSPPPVGESADDSLGKGGGKDVKVGRPAQVDLLADLEDFIRDRRESGDWVNFKNLPIDAADDAADDNQTTVTWNLNHIDAESDTAVVELTEAKQEPADEVVNLEPTIVVSKTEDLVVDESEVRRLELRKRLASLKAKDSKEAASRALKKMFGG